MAKSIFSDILVGSLYLIADAGLQAQAKDVIELNAKMLIQPSWSSRQKFTSITLDHGGVIHILSTI